MGGTNLNKYLPLSEATFYILVALVEPLHGYGVMQKIEAMSGGKISVGPGTLYGAFTTLEAEKLIVMHGQEDRRKYYVLTEKGRAVLRAQIERLEMMVRCGQEALGAHDAGYSAGTDGG
ncbi:MAG: helix-turn-helix transcriptional regulator [Anaerolineae bacterium]